MLLEFYKRIIKDEMYCIKNGLERQYDLTIPRLIAKEENKNVLATWFRMMISLLRTGCTFKEYYNLGFAQRKIRNQKTFITTGSNLYAYKKLNNKNYYHLYINKDEFNEVYAEFIGRDWINLSADKSSIYTFFNKHDDVIIKPKDGDSGKRITVVHGCKKLTAAEVDQLLCGNESGIAEQLLHNHPALNALNSSSLNTMRVVTVRHDETVNVLFAGIRFGAKGCEIDNISAGGYIAPIDLSSGKICGCSHTKKTVNVANEINTDHIGFQMPMWEELYSYLDRLTAVVPQMRYMAWDIAITEKGFVAIEGNHSSGNTVIQAHLGKSEQGLRVKLNQLMDQINK